ncbi:glutamate synthase [Halalkalibacter wakoensis JCM 9140]|uniref:Glutamate synthase n=1 Tax=Halalkalibacter wakoensis JCM 9140 TaxID=1236970 RepID=W4Q748_9BACI|nr:glutamate synthase subunit beta [Halalkalibacter wakoensis]GAE27827.1 glutamate synthase [Halalkalibacter wakoensis JCM 9140]
MGKPTGFIDYQRQSRPERDPKKRINDWDDYTLRLDEKELKQQGARCMDCGIPTCHTGTMLNGMTSGCPVHHLIPEWNDLVYQGQWQEALKREHKMNNFPEFTGMACPAPCEGACVLGINEPPVAIRSIELEIVEKGFKEGWVKPEPPEVRTDKKVAVVGSGPAGLACAAQLNKAGHQVTVFERHDRIGGLLTYGIPEMKLPYRIVERRVNLLKEEGISFVTNTDVGKDYPISKLQEQYDSIVLCGGATKHRDIEVEGSELKGVHYAMDFLHANTKSLLDSALQDNKYISAKDKDVVVIGGGDTGTDCLATSVRHGCRSLTQFDIYEKKGDTRPDDNPWPQWPVIHRVEYGHKEASAVFGSDPRAYAVMTKKFVGDENGHIKEIHTIGVETTKDEQGRKVRKEIPGTEKVWPAQLVLLAIGFSGPEQHLIQKLKVETDNRSNVKAEYGKYKTNIEGVFAAGDMRRGQSLIVWAINEGREAARECDKYLMGESSLP